LEDGAEPSRILLVTFTRVAAKDLEDELEEFSSMGATAINKGTLHAYCFSTLRKANVLQVTGRVPRPLLSFEERFLLEDLKLFTVENIHQRKKRLKAFEAAWAREQDQEPGWPTDENDRNFQAHLEDWLKFHHAILLGELIPITLTYLRNNPGCEERTQFDHVLVDEYQDLNKAEQSLIDLLSENSSLIVIGDEDQSIYENFRFAHPEGISRFDDTHEGTYDVPLELCRRCPTSIINVANELIRNNIRRTGRSLQPFPGNPPGTIHIVQWPSLESETEGIVNFLQNKITSGEFDAGKTLVISPRRQFGYRIRDGLRASNIPAHSFFHEEALYGNPKDDDSNQAQQAFILLALLRNPEDRVSLRCWLGFGSQTLRVNEYQRLKNYCSTNPVSPKEALDSLVNSEINIRHTTGITERYRRLIQRLEHLQTLHAPDIFNLLFPPGEEWAVPAREIVESTVEEWTIDNIYDSLLTMITQPELPTDVDYVRIMSLHKSKGLTADHVVVTGLIEGLIPSQGDDNLSFEQQNRLLEEQRRLFYVAITRPKQTLVLS
jgi:superfamily I DNA/RNA helicase